MAISVVVYGAAGDGAAFAALGALRSIIGEMRLEANVQIITDPVQTANAGVDRTPAVSIDNLIIAQGYVPSRNEIARALQMKLEQIAQIRRNQE